MGKLLRIADSRQLTFKDWLKTKEWDWAPPSLNKYVINFLPFKSIVCCWFPFILAVLCSYIGYWAFKRCIMSAKQLCISVFVRFCYICVPFVVYFHFRNTHCNWTEHIWVCLLVLHLWVVELSRHWTVSGQSDQVFSRLISTAIYLIMSRNPAACLWWRILDSKCQM